MFIAKGLLIKGLGGLGAVAGAGAAIYGIYKIIPREDNTAINNKITEILKLPEDCKFTGKERNNTKECTLTKNQLKVVNFSNKENTDLTVTGLDSDTNTITLEIKKFNTPTDEEKKRYKNDLSSNDLWFTFKTGSITTDITIKKGESDTENQIKLVKGANPEFKINTDNKLEKAWTVATLGEKVGLTCPATAGGNEKKCTVEANKEISYKEGDEIKKLTTTAQATEKITYTEDQQDYNQGFKFTVASDGISGTNSTTLAAGDYEIKYEAGDNKGWHLAKKTTG